MMRRIVFALFLLLVFSLGLMKPGIPARIAILTPTDAVFPALFLVWVFAIATRRMNFIWHPAYTAFAVYFSALLLSAIFSTQPRLSFAKLAGEGYLIMLAVSTTNIVTSLARLRLVLFAWIAGALIPLATAVLGIILFYSAQDAAILREITYHYGAVPAGNFPRISSTFVTPSMFCNFLTVTAALVVISRWMQWISRRTTVVLITLIALCSAFTVSITLGGMFLVAGLLAWRYLPGSPIRRVALGVGLAGAFAFVAISPISLVPASSQRINEPLLGERSSSRLLVWSDAASRFEQKPVLGWGVGTPAASVLYQNSDGTFSILTDAHNTFLNVGVQSGILGVIGLIFLILSVLRTSRPHSAGELSSVRAGLAIAFVAAFIYDGLTGSFENARHLWILIGLILAVDSMDSDKRQGSTA